MWKYKKQDDGSYIAWIHSPDSRWDAVYFKNKEDIYKKGYHFIFKGHFSSFRHFPHSNSDRKYALDKEYKKYIRPKRNNNNLPNLWDDIYIHNEKNWKFNTKCRHQWEINL